MLESERQQQWNIGTHSIPNALVSKQRWDSARTSIWSRETLPKMIEDNEAVSKSSEERLIAKFLDERTKGPKSGKSQCGMAFRILTQEVYTVREWMNDKVWNPVVYGCGWQVVHSISHLSEAWIQRVRVENVMHSVCTKHSTKPCQMNAVDQGGDWRIRRDRPHLRILILDVLAFIITAQELILSQNTAHTRHHQHWGLLSQWWWQPSPSVMRKYKEVYTKV